MNKNELVSIVAEKAEVTKKTAEDIFDMFLATIQETLENGEKVVISGFGTFEVRQRIARKGHNPRTGEDISIPAQNTPAFRAGKTLKDAVK